MRTTNWISCEFTRLSSAVFMMHAVAAYIVRSKSVTYEAPFHLGCCLCRLGVSALGFRSESSRALVSLICCFRCCYWESPPDLFTSSTGRSSNETSTNLQKPARSSSWIHAGLSWSQQGFHCIRAQENELCRTQAEPQIRSRTLQNLRERLDSAEVRAVRQTQRDRRPADSQEMSGSWMNDELSWCLSGV